MGMETNGKLHTVFDTTKVSERFTKREFVVEIADNPKYPQLVLFQLTGDRCGQLDDLRVGDEVRVEFSLRGREWRSPKGETKYFNSLDVWKVEPGHGGGGGSRRGGGGDSRGGGGGGGGYGGDPRGGGSGGSGGGGGRRGGGDPRDESDIPPRGDDDAPGTSSRDDDLPF